MGDKKRNNHFDYWQFSFIFFAAFLTSVTPFFVLVSKPNTLKAWPIDAWLGFVAVFGTSAFLIDLSSGFRNKYSCTYAGALVVFHCFILGIVFLQGGSL